MADDIYLIEDSVLPSPLQHQRFLVIESLLQRLNALPQNVVVILTDIVTPTALMAFADHFSLIGDGWEFAKGEAEQRELIKTAIEIHRHKGTPWAIRQALQVIGFGDAVLIEHSGYRSHDGGFRHDGSDIYRSANWWEYDLRINRPLTREQATKIRLALVEIAPARAVLKRIFVRAVIRHDSTIRHSGDYGYGKIVFDENDL